MTLFILKISRAQVIKLVTPDSLLDCCRGTVFADTGVGLQKLRLNFGLLSQRFRV